MAYNGSGDDRRPGRNNYYDNSPSGDRNGAPYDDYGRDRGYRSPSARMREVSEYDDMSRPGRQRPSGDEGQPRRQRSVDGEGRQIRRQRPVDDEDRQVRRQRPVDSDGRPVRRQRSVDSDGRPVRRQRPVDSDGRPVRSQRPVDSDGRPVRRQRPVDSDGQPVRSQRMADSEGQISRRQRPADSKRQNISRQITGDIDVSGGRGGSGGSRPPKKKKSKKTLILFFFEIIIILGLLGFIYFVRQTSRVEKIRINEEAITIEMNQTVAQNETMKGYRNIAMFGVDSREGTLGKGTRSDTIIIASINQDTGDVKLMSVFRDTYLNLGNDTYNKCNSAYAKGGPEQAVIMLNKNLDLDITDYITVGFDGLIEVIDALGGVEINVTDAEIQHLNNYQISMVGTTKDGINFTANAGTDYTPVTKSGMQTLNGLQATAYCRIRYIGNDFQRAQRQRDVITAISLKAKKASVTQLNGVVNGVMDNVSTSLDVNEILGVAADLARYNVTGSDGFPFEQYRDTGRVGSKGDCVIPVDLKANVIEAHKFLFNEENYQVSPEIEQYTTKISTDTGKKK